MRRTADQWLGVAALASVPTAALICIGLVGVVEVHRPTVERPIAWSDTHLTLQHPGNWSVFFDAPAGGWRRYVVRGSALEFVQISVVQPFEVLGRESDLDALVFQVTGELPDAAARVDVPRHLLGRDLVGRREPRDHRVLGLSVPLEFTVWTLTEGPCAVSVWTLSASNPESVALVLDSLAWQTGAPCVPPAPSEE